MWFAFKNEFCILNYSKEVLIRVIERLKVEKVIDVRSSPFSALQTDFNRTEITKWLPCKYTWRKGLGGRTEIDDSALEYLINEGAKRDVLILCAEKDFRNCHRHTVIAERLYSNYKVKVKHIVGVEGETYVPTKVDFLGSPQQSLF